ncbi:hypothetical protein DC498_21510, partial [Terrimonas sp.]
SNSLTTFCLKLILYRITVWTSLVMVLQIFLFLNLSTYARTRQIADSS